MSPRSRREILVGGAAIGIAGVAVAAEPRRIVNDFALSRLGDLVPRLVGGRVGVDDEAMVPEVAGRSVLQGQTLARRYASPTAPAIMLLIAYHGPRSLDLKVHRPETCYAVDGFQVDLRAPLALNLGGGVVIPAVSFRGRRAERTEAVLYWTRVGSAFPQSLGAQRLSFLTQGLAGLLADGLLVRISTIGGDVELSRNSLYAFAQNLFAASHGGRDLLVGRRVGQPDGGRA